jgi:hypothetical protein
MIRWSIRQAFALLLTVFVTLGMGLSAVQASSMAVKMATMPAMGMSAHDDCQGCDGSKFAKDEAVACAATCVAPVAAVLPQMGLAAVDFVPASLVPPEATLLAGVALPFDPDPPRTSALR